MSKGGASGREKDLAKKDITPPCQGTKGLPRADQSAAFSVHSVEGMIRDQERFVIINQRFAIMGVVKPRVLAAISPSPRYIGMRLG